MAEQKNLDDAVDKLEAAVDPNTVISVGGYNFTPAKLMIAGTILTTVLGGLYGSFEVYKDYMDMKEKIQQYVTPDLTEIYKKIELLEVSTDKAVEYTNEIRTDLKGDIRRIEKVVESVETSTKSDQRLSDASMKEIRRYSDQTVKELNAEMTKMQKENAMEIRALRREVDDKIKKALDNPLAN
jgi:uncharacterized protein YoxC